MHVSTIGKKLVKHQYFLTCPHNMMNFGPLVAEIGQVVWGTPPNVNGFRVLAALLQRRRSPEANQTLHDVWPSPGLLHYIHFRGLLPLTEFCPVQNSLYVQVFQVLRRGIQGMKLHNFCRGRHLYSAGRPSRWALAHILVFI